MNNRWHAHTHAHAHIRPEKAFTQNSILIMRSIPKKNWTSGWERRRRMKRWSEEETMKTDLHMILSIRHKFCCVYFCCFCCTEVYRGVQRCTVLRNTSYYVFTSQTISSWSWIVYGMRCWKFIHFFVVSFIVRTESGQRKKKE